MVDRVDTPNPREGSRPEPTPVELFDRILVNPMVTPENENMFFADLNALSRAGGTQIPEVADYFGNLRSEPGFAQTFGRIRLRLIDNIISYADAVAGNSRNQEARRALREGLSTAQLLGFYEEPEVAEFLNGISIPEEPEQPEVESMPLDEGNKVVQAVKRLEAFDREHSDQDLRTDLELGDRRLIIEEGVNLNISELNFTQFSPDRLLSLLSPDTQASVLAVVKLQGEAAPQVWRQVLQEYERYGYVSRDLPSPEIDTGVVKQMIAENQAKQSFLDLVKGKTLAEKLNYVTTPEGSEGLRAIDYTYGFVGRQSAVLWDTDLTTVDPRSLQDLHLLTDIQDVIAAKVQLMGDRAPQAWKDYVLSTQDRTDPFFVAKLFFGAKLDEYRQRYSQGEDVTDLEGEILQFLMPAGSAPKNLDMFYPDAPNIPLHLLKKLEARLSDRQELRHIQGQRRYTVVMADAGRQGVNAIRRAETPEELRQVGKEFRVGNFHPSPSLDRKLSDLWDLKGDESYFGLEKAMNLEGVGGYVNPIWMIRHARRSGDFEEEAVLLEKYFSSCSSELRALISSFIQISRETPYKPSEYFRLDEQALETALLREVGIDPDEYHVIQNTSRAAANEWAESFYYNDVPTDQLVGLFVSKNLLGIRFYKADREFRQRRHELDKRLQQQSGLENQYSPAKRGYVLTPIASTSS